MRRNQNYYNCRECTARHDSIFCNLSEEQLDDINRHKAISTYKKKSVIFSQGTTPHGIYTVNTGKVKVYQLMESGKEQIVRLAKPGDVIGYRALVTGEKYLCSAETLEESKICFIPKAKFSELFEKNSTISANLIRLLSADLRKAEHKITELVEKPVKERLAETLLFLKEIYGLESDNVTLNIVITRGDIANITGTSTETAIRLLSDFKDARLIDFNGKKIVFKDLNALADLANISD